MFLAMAAAALPLLVIGADDERLQSRRTYVSEEARSELAAENGERVLCLDRKRQRETYRSICLTEAQWRKAIALAETQPKARWDFRGEVPVYFGGPGSEAQGGSLASAYP
jgi:hypothetical protein